MQPALITFRPENFLTIGLIATLSLGVAVLGVQLANRWGFIKLSSAAPSVPAGTNATA